MCPGSCAVMRWAHTCAQVSSSELTVSYARQCVADLRNLRDQRYAAPRTRVASEGELRPLRAAAQRQSASRGPAMRMLNKPIQS